MVTQNEQMKKILLYCNDIAWSPHPILITGETGVGKATVARKIHQLSDQKGIFHVFNVTGLNDHIFKHMLIKFNLLIDSQSCNTPNWRNELIYMEDIGDLNTESQNLLWQSIKTTYNNQFHFFPRIIASTHLDLMSLKQLFTYHKDLYRCLSTHHIHIPPLRERLDDIPILFDFFLNQTCQQFNIPLPSYSDELIVFLQLYHFPGNIRELKGMVIDALYKNKAPALNPESFQEFMIPHYA